MFAVDRKQFTEITLSPERQSARMSKITNDGLTRSGRHRMLYSCTHMATVGAKRVKLFYLMISYHYDER